MPIRLRLHSQMSKISLHSVRRWIRVSRRPHNRQRSVSLRFILARRTFVGTISCTLYHSARIVSDVQTACRFCHTLVYCVLGYKVSILISFVPQHACAILCSVRYICCRSFTVVSCVFPCWISNTFLVNGHHSEGNLLSFCEGYGVSDRRSRVQYQDPRYPAVMSVFEVLCQHGSKASCH